MAYIGRQQDGFGVRSRFIFTATGGQTTFTTDDSSNALSYSDGAYVDVYLNGVLLDPSDYTATSLTSIVLDSGASADDVLEVIVYDVFSVFSGTFTNGITANEATITNGISAGSATVNGNVSLGDNNKAIFGAGSDLEIYHSGAGSFISDVGNGALHIRGTNLILQNGDGTKRFIDGNDGGAVEIHHADATNGIKLATTSTGIDVTGTITADGLTVDSTSSSEIKIDATATAALNGQFVIDSNRGFEGNILGGMTGRWDGTDVVQVRFDAGNDTTNKDNGSIKIKTSSAGSLIDRIKVDYNGDISFYEDTGTTPKFFWDASAERLGIGTTSPTHALTVDGDIKFSSQDSKIVFLTGNSSANTIRAEDGSGFASAEIKFLGVGANQTTDIVFSTGDSPGSEDISEAMRIDSSGNVGIGTSSPQAEVHLHRTGSSESAIRFTNGITGSTSSDGLRVGIDINEDGVIWMHDNEQILFGTNNTERMRIESSGNLLVGTTSTGNTNAYFSIQSADRSLLNIGSSSTGNGVALAHFRNPNGIVGKITTNTNSTNYATTSDYRLKENVTDITNGIERVKQLNPLRFNFITDANTTVDGFLAHEAQAVVPEAVTGTKDAVDADGNPDYQGIDQSKLVPLLTAALQEAITKIETLEAKVTALENA